MIRRRTLFLGSPGFTSTRSAKNSAGQGAAASQRQGNCEGGRRAQKQWDSKVVQTYPEVTSTFLDVIY